MSAIDAATPTRLRLARAMRYETRDARRWMRVDVAAGGHGHPPRSDAPRKRGV